MPSIKIGKRSEKVVRGGPGMAAPKIGCKIWGSGKFYNPIVPHDLHTVPPDLNTPSGSGFETFTTK